MKYSNIYLIGIGGIGMSAIARYYKVRGANVSGYDRTESPLTKMLEKEGIEVHYDDNPSFIPKDVKNTLVVYTPAVPTSMCELKFVNENGYRVIKRSRILGEICQGQSCLAVAGTHGKTSTSTMIAHILRESGTDCSAFLGGISRNFGTNMLAGQSAAIVVEADEFDRSFHQLTPTIAAITSIEADHLDIYGSYEAVLEAFRIFASQITEALIVKKGLPISCEHTDAKIYSYSVMDETADIHAKNIRKMDDGHYIYDFVYPGGTIHNVRVGTLGKVNIENSLAAAAVCLCYGADPQKIKNAIGSFSGVKRRGEEHVNNGRVIYIDDYAHHPTELETTIDSLRETFDGKKITAVFQPHLFTRTRDFADEFARVLSKVDKLILLGIYPARELPIEGVSSNMIFNKVQCREKILIDRTELLDYLEKDNDIDVLVTFGAGDIDRFVEPITKMMAERK